MIKLITLPLEFDGKEYCILVKIKEVENSTEFVVTIMDGALESILYGSHQFKWQSGRITTHTRPGEHLVTSYLKERIVKVLEEYIHSHPTNESIF